MVSRASIRYILGSALILFFGLLLVVSCQSQNVKMPIVPKTAVPGQMKRDDPLTCPTVPAQPSQAEQGAFVYCQVCMTCHGDVGQGLDEWRKELDPPDNNCFQAECHGPRHPPEGFEIPKYAPVVMGAGVLDHYGDANTLHDYLVRTMPWWNPGYLQPEEYWQLTAFLLEANGVSLNQINLNGLTAPFVTIKTK
jgi:mono/diheme cytochrome c family protein